MMVAPYLIYLPCAMLFNFYAGLAAIGTVGVIGIIFFNKLSTININRVLKNRYEISS